MTEHKQGNIIKLAVMVFILLFGTVLIMRSFNSQKQQQQTVTLEKNDTNAPAIIDSLVIPPQVPPAVTKPQPTAPKSTKPKLQDIVRLRNGWGPIFTSWYGEPAPDFTVKDLQGKEVKLGSLRGKNVMVVFWATWCGPCVSEIPALMTLRGMYSEDKLAILAISNESYEKVKKFASDRKLNYTVITHDTYYLPRPYNEVTGIPTTYFINPDGKVKVATEGAVPFNDMRALIEAE